MEDLSESEQAELRADLLRLIEDLEAHVGSAREGAAPVDLDEPIGRLSRMDAIQQQKMTEANRRAAEQRLARSRSALRRISEGEYGECVSCGEPVGFARLKARPETPFCLSCQSSREAGR